MTTAPRILVAGIGNIFCSDDGFGVEVGTRLASETFPDGVEVREMGIRGVHLAFELLDGYDALVLVDAMPLGDAPGTLAAVEVDLADLGGADAAVTIEAHTMTPVVVLDMLAGLGGAVGRVVVVGCEPADLTEGMGLSEPVAAAVEPAIELVHEVVGNLRASPVGTVSSGRHERGGSPVARFKIVSDRSTVEINGRSTLHAITSSSPGVEGYIDLTVDDGVVVPSAHADGELVLRVDTIRSGNTFQDRELHRRIEARRYPTISGRLTGIAADGSATRFRVAGDLTFMGVTRRCEDLVTIDLTEDGTVHIAGESTFDVRDFGMDPPRILMVRVEPTVLVRLDAVAAPVDGG